LKYSIIIVLKKPNKFSIVFDDTEEEAGANSNLDENLFETKDEENLVSLVKNLI
jgi:hypothetical protein